MAHTVISLDVTPLAQGRVRIGIYIHGMYILTEANEVDTAELSAKLDGLRNARLLRPDPENPGSETTPFFELSE